jgi:mono/diheme cytochrome c family protein
MKKLFASFLPSATVALAALALAGCTTSSPSAHARGGSSDSGARLWAQNCTRCHNSRSPDSYSNAQWEVAMLHMRVRANLTAEEHKSILEFLQSGH